MKILVTGGAGFIGCNLADYFLNKKSEVIVFDNLSRKGVEKNLEWLKSNHKKMIFVKGDIRDFDSLRAVNKNVDIIFHTAAQTAVTNSVKNPREDFEVNALGTLNVLEAARCSNSDPSVIFCSTNKVYGNNVNKITLVEKETRYEFADSKYDNGIPEEFLTDANEHTPYGCSKYASDVYIRDYSAVYGLKTVTLRMSCIFGEHQHGCSDQGWLDYMLRCAVGRKPITVYGDGKQVRDILHIADLVKAFELAVKNVAKIKGQAFNIGGGPKNTISIIELMNLLKNDFGVNVKYSFGHWRPFDQLCYISDIRKAKKEFGWEPEVSKIAGIRKQYEWIASGGV